MFIVQCAELKMEIADFERTNDLTIPGSKTAANDLNINIPSARQVYGEGQGSYQEKLARNMYYSKVTSDTLNIIGGASAACSSFLNSILR